VCSPDHGNETHYVAEVALASPEQAEMEKIKNISLQFLINGTKIYNTLGLKVHNLRVKIRNIALPEYS